MTAIGYFGIGIANGKTHSNLGTLWRSAYQMGAAFIFTVGARYKRQITDTAKTPKHLPLFQFEGEHDFALPPHDCPLIGIEIGGKPLVHTCHPDRAVYVLGAEDHGLPKWLAARCHRVVEVPSLRTESFNVAVAGSIVMYDRLAKRLRS